MSTQYYVVLPAWWLGSKTRAPGAGSLKFLRQSEGDDDGDWHLGGDVIGREGGSPVYHLLRYIVRI